MIALLLLSLVGLAVLTSVVFLLGFNLGGEQWQEELIRVRMEASQAERKLHDLTRQAFVSMAEAVEQSRNSRP